MKLNMHGAFPVEAITIPPLNVVAYHSAPRDHHHWIVSQVMKGEIAYPVVTGLSKQDAKILATISAPVFSTIGKVVSGESKWWQSYGVAVNKLQEVIGEIVFEIMSSGVSDDTKKRFSSAGEIVAIMGKPKLLWCTDSVNLPVFNPATAMYEAMRPMTTRRVHFIEDDGSLLLRTVPEVWVQQELEK